MKVYVKQYLCRLTSILLLAVFVLIIQVQAYGKSESTEQAVNTASEKEKKDIEKQAPLPEGIKVTFVEIGSVKCIPCKMMQPVMKAIEEEYKGQVKIVFHDVWTEEGRPHGIKYKIQAIPTQVFLDSQGKEYFRHVGFFPKEEVVKVLKMKGVN